MYFSYQHFGIVFDLYYITARGYREQEKYMISKWNEKLNDKFQKKYYLEG